MKGKGSKSALVEALESRRLLSAFLSMGQPSAITRNPPVALSGAPDPLVHEFEMQTAVNPQNPMDVAVFTTVLDYNQPPSNWLYLRLYWSKDGGATWGPPENFYDAAGDPAVAYASDGNLFVSYINNSNVLDPTGSPYRQVTVRESTDFGTHFLYVAQTSLLPPDITDGVPADADKEFLTTGPVYNDPGQQAVYVSYTDTSHLPQRVRVAAWYEGPGGLSDPVNVPVVASDEGQFSTAAVSPTGNLYVAYQGVDYFGNNIYFSRALNGPWASNQPFDPGPSILAPLPFGKVLWEEKVPAQPDRGIENAPDLAYDPINGTLYAAFVNVQPGFDASSNPDTRVYLTSCSTNLDSTDPNNPPAWQQRGQRSQHRQHPIVRPRLR